MLAEKRRAIRHLLDERNPTDALAVYYAFYHSDDKTQLTVPTADNHVLGYVALSRTGMDLFRPFVTLRLPISDMEASAAIIYEALSPGTAVILNSPDRYLPLLQALFEIHTEEQLQIFVLDQKRFQPVVNVLVTQTASANGLPRFIVRRTAADNEVVAAAGLNWQTDRFADISVNTHPHHQRQGWGRSVVAAMVQQVLESGRTPLYTTTVQNEASIWLARNVGFKASGGREILIQGTLKPRP